MDPSSRPGDRPASSSLSPPDAAAAAQPQLSTPVAEGTDNETEYFPPLDETATVEPTLSQQPATATSTAAGAGGNLSRPPSAQGRTSRRRGTSNVSSHSGGGVGGPTASSSSLAPPPMLGESIRQPSIRIRRRTNSSARPRSAAGAAASTDNLSRTASASSTAAVASDPFTGRRRSLSQPERPPTTADTAAANSRQAPRRAPPTAMPRLTEEGTRPTAEELGVPRSAVQPPPPVSQGLRLSGDRTDEDDDVPAGQPGGRLQAMRTWSRLFRPRAQSQSAEDGDGVASEQSRPASGVPPDTYDERLVDYLDTVDPEVQTLSTLTNVQNSLFVPDLGKWINRRPTYTLSENDYQMQRVQEPSTSGQQQQQTDRPLPQPMQGATPKPPSIKPPSIVEPLPELAEDRDGEATEGTAADGAETTADGTTRPRMYRSSTITSHLTDSHYAALPHGVTLEGWTAEEKWELDDHVRHMMHSRRAKFKRTMKGFGQYVRRPLGFFVTLYATLITLFGLAWVLFLIGWIYVGEEQVYAIHIIDSVLVALFAIMGDGLAPFRAIDTYHMIYIVRYARLVKKGVQRSPSRLRKRVVADEVERQMSQQSVGRPGEEGEGQEPVSRSQSKRSSGLALMVPTTRQSDPAAQDSAEASGSGSGEEGEGRRGSQSGDESVHSHDPHTMRNNIVDAEDTKSGIEAYEDTPLSWAQQQRLYHHQKKLAKSHSFYKPHETDTHYAFPIRYLVAIVVLLDCHSCLQISLGACTWGIDYHTRPFALTTVILCISITCNISAGVIISLGDKRTRKKDVWMLMTRQELTSDAMKQIEHKREKQHEQQQEQEGKERASKEERRHGEKVKGGKE